MYLKDFLEQYNNKKINLYVDMDGVIADYVFGEPSNYHKKRPLYTSINKLEEISKMENVELHIFSATRKTEGIEQKHIWLDKFAPFFKKENRVIISREENNYAKSSTLKALYMKNLERDGSIIIIIDDDPQNLREINTASEDVIVLKDTALVD